VHGDLLNSWPGRERRDPAITDENYLVLKPLAEAIRQAFIKNAAGQNNLSVLDVGCGDRPYYPFFVDRVGRYTGVDLAVGKHADVVCAARQQPFADAEFDAALCFQVLEHVDDPAGCLAEIFRVLKPGGFCLVSTHGIWYYHPDPNDFWRWTHAGLQKIFREAGFSAIDIVPNGGTISAVFCQLSVYTHLALKQKRHWSWLRGRFVSRLNRMAPRLETCVQQFQFPSVGYQAINYLAAARKEISSFSVPGAQLPTR
jgi:ubiquinone/menaquinone biosynthesis C-methylase UbiE